MLNRNDVSCVASAYNIVIRGMFLGSTWALFFQKLPKYSPSTLPLTFLIGWDIDHDNQQKYKYINSKKSVFNQRWTPISKLVCKLGYLCRFNLILSGTLLCYNSMECYFESIFNDKIKDEYNREYKDKTRARYLSGFIAGSYYSIVIEPFKSIKLSSILKGGIFGSILMGFILKKINNL